MDETSWMIVVAGIIAGPALGFAGAWLGYRSTATRTAREQATQQAEAFYARLIADNERLSAENVDHEQRMQELALEVSGLNRRVGTYEADLARLRQENTLQRDEIERLANRLTQETIEKRQLAEHLLSEQREKRELLKRVTKLEATLAGMAGVISTAANDGDGDGDD